MFTEFHSIRIELNILLNILERRYTESTPDVRESVPFILYTLGRKAVANAVGKQSIGELSDERWIQIAPNVNKADLLRAHFILLICSLILQAHIPIQWAVLLLIDESWVPTGIAELSQELIHVLKRRQSVNWASQESVDFMRLLLFTEYWDMDQELEPIVQLIIKRPDIVVPGLATWFLDGVVNRGDVPVGIKYDPDGAHCDNMDDRDIAWDEIGDIPDHLKYQYHDPGNGRVYCYNINDLIDDILRDRARDHMRRFPLDNQRIQDIVDHYPFLYGRSALLEYSRKS